MSNSIDFGDMPQKEIVAKRQFTFRLNLFFFGVFLLFSILVVRLAMLQFVEGKELKMLKDMSTEKHNPIPPIRGNIYDRNGYPIAFSESTQSLFFRIEKGQKPEEVIELAQKLANVFAQLGTSGKGAITAEEIIKRMDVGYDLNKQSTTKPSYNYLPRRLKSDLSPEEIAYIAEHRDDFKWIEITEESIRRYNRKQVAVQLVGYLRPFAVAREPKNGLDFYKKIAETGDDPAIRYLDNEDVGFDGLEYMYQEELRGKNGFKSYPIDAAQKIIGQMSITAPVKGNDLFLTIDKDVQLTAQQAIIDQLKAINQAYGNKYMYAPNAKTGYAVAMEVDTGEVVAMASMPDYDSNIWRGGISQTDWEQNQFFMKNGTISETRPKYMDPKDPSKPDGKEINKHPTSLVYLGSTMKPLSVLLGLNEKLFTQYERYNDIGSFTFGKDGTKISNSDGKAWGPINASDAIWHSSNTYMSEMVGNRLYFREGKKGLDIWDSYMEQFGLGVLTGSGLRGESPGLKDYLAEAKNASAQSALVRSAWGQMGKYTTLQLAQYTAMLANRGKRLKPLFVQKIKTHEGQTVNKLEPNVLNEVKLPKEYWDVVQSGMLKVFKTGFDDFPYPVAAKTGTSTQSVGGRHVDNAVFIAYAPADKPKLAVAVIIPEGGYGSWGAAPIARKIFDAYDQHVGFDGVPKLNGGGAESP